MQFIIQVNQKGRTSHKSIILKLHIVYVALEKSIPPHLIAEPKHMHPLSLSGANF